MRAHRGPARARRRKPRRPRSREGPFGDQSQSGLRWRLGGLAAVGVVILLLYLIWRLTDGGPEVPEISTAGLEPAVVQLVDKQLAAVRANRRSGTSWGRLGAICKSFGFSEQAAVCLAEAERLEPREPRWPYLRGMLHSSGPAPVALPHFRRAADLCGNEPEMPRLRLARMLAETGQTDEALAHLQKLLDARPDSGPARLLSAQIRQGRGEWELALQLAGGCVTNPFTARAAWTLMSSLHRRQGDTNAADQASRRAAAAAPDAAWPDPYEEEVLVWRTDARSLSDRAQNHLLSGRPEAALPLIQRLVQSHPDFSETWLLLGRAQYLQNQPQAAEQSLRRLLQMDGNSVNGQFQLGMSLLAQQRFSEAAATFQQAIALKPDFGPAHFNLAFALVRSGQLREAVAPFREAIRHNPEKIDTYILLADLHLQLGERNEATRLAKLAEQLDPSDRRLPTLRQKLGQ